MPTDSKKGCLVIHGLSGTPETMRPVVDELNRAGFLVAAPLLPGHGTTPKDLAFATWQEWWKTVENAYFELNAAAESICCVGLSLGSLLALKLAEERQFKIKAVVSIGTPLVVSNGVEYLAYPLVKYSPARWIYKFSKKDWEISVADPEGRSFYMEHSYDRLSVHSVFELFTLKKAVRRNLHKITSPVLLIHGREDEVAPLKNVELVKEGLRSNMVDVKIMDRSRHVVTLDYDKAETAKSTVAFLERFA